MNLSIASADHHAWSTSIHAEGTIGERKCGCWIWLASIPKSHLVQRVRGGRRSQKEEEQSDRLIPRSCGDDVEIRQHLDRSERAAAGEERAAVAMVRWGERK
jgi:hypothetical protein